MVLLLASFESLGLRFFPLMFCFFFGAAAAAAAAASSVSFFSLVVSFSFLTLLTNWAERYKEILDKPYLCVCVCVCVGVV